ncbi:MAG: hypothetical protein CMH63_01290 [Nanoarchaeota archaeon]|nr:hypothetical protein [Nanoarchaeota archaeon]|tara:strand:+ start:38494 stop:39861 length:1368 start_codon:yes stop_codon:yes gene_type:complete
MLRNYKVKKIKFDRRRKTNIGKRELSELYLDKKLNYRQLTAHFKCSRNTISYWIRKYNLPVRNQSQTMKLFVNRPEKISKKELYDLYVIQKLSITETAKKCECKYDTIVRKLRKYGFANKFSKGKKVEISKEEIRRLYIGKKLTTYDIAEKMGCCQASIWKKLKFYKIKRRDSCSSDYFNIPSKKLLKELYIKKGLSTWNIERKYGYSRSTVHTHLKKHGLIRSRAEAHRRYPRKDFKGNTLMKAYMIGFRIGDLRVRKIWENSETIHVDCGTTIPEQIELIKNLFGKYGRIWMKKIKSRNDNCYQIEALLNESFSFLLDNKVPKWVFGRKDCFSAFLAGFTDAEGTIGINMKMAYYSLVNQDKELLIKIRNKLGSMGLIIPKLILGSKKGSPRISKNRIYYSNKDCWSMRVHRKDSMLKLLNSLEPYLKHSKKTKNLKLAKQNIMERNEKFGVR